MAQMFASTPLDIYNTLTADTTFMSYVGSYKFTTGEVLPSIIVNTPGEDLPQVASQSGLEVIIHDIGNMAQRSYISGPSDAIFTWSIFLICWEPETGDGVRNALTRILSLFPKATSFETVTTGVVLGAKFQTQVVIPSDSLIITA